MQPFHIGNGYRNERLVDTKAIPLIHEAQLCLPIGGGGVYDEQKGMKRQDGGCGSCNSTL